MMIRLQNATARLPVRHVPLVCTWISTGNRRQPFACVWTRAARQENEDTSAPALPLCA